MTDASKRIVVVGAGPAGILMGIRLLERGHTNFVIYERAPGLGGTWWNNRYPGIACDVPSAYYTYSFAPNTMSTSTFASGQQLYQYFRAVAEHYGVPDYIQYNTEVVDATWDGARWELTTAAGDTEIADIFVSAVGRLHRPRYPEIAGLDDFGGLITHSTYWDENYDLTGKRLGVIGTGSTAIQIVTASAKVVDHLDLFQRTAQWVLPIDNAPIPEDVLQERREHPELATALYRELEAEMAKLEGPAVGDSEAARERARLCYEHLATVKDPVLRAKLTPNYAVGCKRMVMSGEFYNEVQRPNVEVVTEGIERIEERGIRTVDGVLHELDVIILATGFHADSYLRPMTVTGEDGKTLDDIWADVYMNYKSVMLPYMPNLFTINGPFSPGGSISILAIIENHVHYIMQVIDRIRAEDVAITPDWDRSATLIEAIRERAKGTVWYTGGCTSWYLDKNGVPLVNPLTLPELVADMKEPIWADLIVKPLKELVPA